VIPGSPSEAQSGEVSTLAERSNISRAYSVT
jgi:hypothetical protein